MVLQARAGGVKQTIMVPPGETSEFSGPLERYLDALGGVDDVSELMGLFEDLHQVYGFASCVYAILRKEMQAMELGKALIYHNFPPEWLELYTQKNYFDIDPIVNQSPLQSKPFYWSDIGRLTTLSEEQKGYIRDFSRYGYKEGLAVPVFNAKGTIAYFGFGATTENFRLTEGKVLEMQVACQQTHLKYLEIGGVLQPDFIVLSPREKEVLYWIAQGKSNSVIASILDISDHTVDTLVRRCFSKLGVTNRVSAALRGVGAGLIKS
uniref:LuxR family transcriptional regulator n=2 Tax=Aquisalinus luteolus TaxID=1566827 RepID=A0A8J3EUH6_9PROT|nr:LuxR family transcriptional regulator [Aquisalinus luteolus]